MEDVVLCDMMHQFMSTCVLQQNRCVMVRPVL